FLASHPASPIRTVSLDKDRCAPHSVTLNHIIDLDSNSHGIHHLLVAIPRETVGRLILCCFLISTNGPSTLDSAVFFRAPSLPYLKVVLQTNSSKAKIRASPFPS